MIHSPPGGKTGQQNKLAMRKRGPCVRVTLCPVYHPVTIISLNEAMCRGSGGRGGGYEGNRRCPLIITPLIIHRLAEGQPGRTHTEKTQSIKTGITVLFYNRRMLLLGHSKNTCRLITLLLNEANGNKS